MITLEPDHKLGTVRLYGPVPNGDMRILRQVTGRPDVLVRGSAYTVTAGGFVLLDAEAPYSRNLRYKISISGIPLNLNQTLNATRLIQQNLMPNPTFRNGQQGWLPGTGRTLAIQADNSAHQPVVGHFTPVTSPGAPAATPTYIGHADSGPAVNSAYTLTPPTSGATAIAINDQMLLVHDQLVSAATPSAPVGWVQIASRTDGPLLRIVWQRKRQTGDTSVVVAAAGSSDSIGTLLWVRGAIDEVLLSAALPFTVPGPAGQPQSLTTVGRSVLRGHLTVGIVDAYTQDPQALPTAGYTSGATWRYTVGPATGNRSITIATSSDGNGGITVPTTVAYTGPITGGGALDVIFQAAGALTSRVIARARITELAASDNPYLFTGRVRYVTPGLYTWADIKALGSWQTIRDTKPTWLDVRGVSSSTGGDFGHLFLTIVDPVTGMDYIDPVQVRGLGDAQVNTWLDFSALVSVPSGIIPATAEIRLLHGNQVKEYAAEWYLDEFGITPGDQWTDHSTLYWFYGSTPVPRNPTDLMYPGQGWVPDLDDASISWTGAVGNSISQFFSSSAVSQVATTFLTLPDDVRLPSEPILLSDPLNMNLWSWVGLLEVGDLAHPARQAIFQIINRADPVANSQVRMWETGELRVITHTIQQRNQFLTLASPGRVLLLRNPETEYPENDWYLALGDITESRLIPNARKQERAWTLPFVRVAQPVSIPTSTPIRNTWLDVRNVGTWSQVKTHWHSWSDMLTDDA